MADSPGGAEEGVPPAHKESGQEPEPEAGPGCEAETEAEMPVPAPGRAPVRLASTVTVPTGVPTTVFVHGLDSSKDTWAPVILDLVKAGYPCLALDQRGHGHSPLGDPEQFGPEALAGDIFAAAECHGITQPFILVGHSMGGLVSLRAAAMEAERVACGLPPRLVACVIEDIDTRRRPGPTPPDDELTDDQRQQLRRWESPRGRHFDSWESCLAALMPWYDNDKRRIEGWKGPTASTRVSPCKDGNGWWCDHNPAAKRLAQKTILDSTSAAEAWKTLADTAHAEAATSRQEGVDSNASASSRCPMCVPAIQKTVAQLIASVSASFTVGIFGYRVQKVQCVNGANQVGSMI